MRTKFFYGWIIVLVLFLIYMGTNGIGLNTFLPNFLPVFVKEFNISIEKASQLPAIIYLVVALPLPFVGLLLDRLNPRNLMIAGCIMSCALLWYLQFIRSYDMAMIFCILFPLVLSFSGLITSMYFINNWFVKYKGLATGILLSASSIGPALLSPVIGSMIKEQGWQQAAQFMAMAGTALLLIPVFFLKNRPADAGTWPDGMEGTQPSLPLKPDAAAVKAHFTAALRDYRFYLVLIITCAMWFCIVSYIQSQGLFQKDLKLDAAETGKTIGLFFLASLSGKLVFGFLGDKFNKKTIMLLSIINLLVGAVLLYMTLQDTAYLIPAAIVFGFGYSGVFTMLQLFIIYLFSGPAYGTILGTLAMLDTIAGSTGVLLAGKIRQATGSFENVFFIYIGLTLLALFATMIIKTKPANGQD